MQSTNPLDNELFSIYWRDAAGEHHREKYLQPLPECKEAFDRLTQGPAAIMGFIQSISIVDSLDRMVVDLNREGDKWVRSV